MDINRYTPCYGISKKHLTRISEYSTEEIFEVLYAIRSLKNKFVAKENTAILRGACVALLFGDTSLRTRSAIEIGVGQLGGMCVNLPYSENDMRAGENIKDIVGVISRYGVGAIITRGIAQKELDSFCAVSDIPIINSTNETGVPMQTLCDLFTIWETKGKLEGLKIAYVGKGTSAAASLMAGAIKCGMDIRIASPKGYALDKEKIENARQYGNITVTESAEQAVKDADVVYTDSYHYHSTPTEKELEKLQPYKVDKSLMSLAAHNAIFMHPLPARRGVEVDEEIIDGKSSAVLLQGENKLHTVKAVLAMLVK